MRVLDQFKLEDKVAVITGGSKGLGKAMARGLAEAGAVTVLCSRHADALQAAADEIARATGRDALPFTGDVTSESDVEALMAFAAERFGHVDILINSAGVNERHPADVFPVDSFDRILDTNLKGTWLCCRAVARYMLPVHRGSVINVGSALGMVGLSQRTAYCASKAGVMGLTRTLALEWAASGVRCNALCPGPFLTEINRPLLAEPEKARAVVELTAFKRWGELHEIQGAAVFLASEASSYMTGSALLVDGGWTAG